MRAKVEAVASPGVEVGLHVDGATDALVLADRPVLTEGPGAIDGRLVGPGGDVDVVVAAVGGDAAKVLSARAGVVGSEVLDLRFVSSRIFGHGMPNTHNVVLDERVSCPAVDCEVGVALWRVRSTVVNGAVTGSVFPSKIECAPILPASAGVPALATDEVASVAPVDSVAAAGSVGVGDISTAVGPERVEVTVVVSLGVGSNGTLLDQSRVVGIVALSKEVEGSSNDAGDRSQSEKKGLDSDHDVGCELVCWY